MSNHARIAYEGVVLSVLFTVITLLISHIIVTNSMRNPGGGEGLTPLFIVLAISGPLIVFLAGRYLKNNSNNSKSDSDGLKVLFASVIFVLLLDFGIYFGISSAISAVLALFLAGTIIFKDNWYIRTPLAVVAGVTLGLTFGKMFAIEFILVFMIIQTVHDVVSVFKSEKMQAVADFSTDNNLPLMAIIPYPFTDEELRIGFGDFAIPAIFIATVATHTTAPTIVYRTIIINVPLFFTFIGLLAGVLSLTVIMSYKKRAYPALLFLNTFTIIGYAIGAVLYYAPF